MSSYRPWHRRFRSRSISTTGKLVAQVCNGWKSWGNANAQPPKNRNRNRCLVFLRYVCHWKPPFFWQLPLDEKMNFTKRWIRIFKYTHARIGIKGTKRLHKCNPQVRKLIWVFTGASYTFHSMAEHKDVSCNLQWYMDQFYKPWHRNFSWSGCHGQGDSYRIDTKFWGALAPSLLHINRDKAHLCSTEHISNKFQLKKLWKNKFCKTHLHFFENSLFLIITNICGIP